jgi:hypothetical protein
MMLFVGLLRERSVSKSASRNQEEYIRAVTWWGYIAEQFCGAALFEKYVFFRSV